MPTRGTQSRSYWPLRVVTATGERTESAFDTTKPTTPSRSTRTSSVTGSVAPASPSVRLPIVFVATQVLAIVPGAKSAANGAA